MGKGGLGREKGEEEGDGKEGEGCHGLFFWGDAPG